jgi:DNA-binding winged helix-turn-helix (wHTH) protein
MPDNTSSATDARRRSGQFLIFGTGAVVVILLLTGFFLFRALPEPNAFNDRVERIFAENDALTQPDTVRLLEVLAQSGTAFSDTLASYRLVIFVLFLLAGALLLALLYLLFALLMLNRRVAAIDRQGIQVASLLISREEGLVVLNDMEFRLTSAATETLAVLAEARMDGDILSGAEIEAVIQGRDAADCDEAAGATRIKRLRDSLGNQMVSALLVRNIARKGYVLAVEQDRIRMI